jgi:transcriptional regulator PpsR
MIDIKVLAQDMDAEVAPPFADNPPFPRGMLGALDDSASKHLAAVGGDVAMIIDRDGVICDMAVSSEDMVRDGAGSWLDQRWSDTVTVESKHKVDVLLRDALDAGLTRWREINQLTPKREVMVRYVAVDLGQEGRVLAIGRDDRATAAMQQRLLEAQQSMERDYARLRDVEFRYRLLFRMSGEAVVVVDAASKKIVEANPAAERLVGGGARLVGEPFVKLFEASSQEGAASLLTVAQASSKNPTSQMRLSGRHLDLLVSASLFRQDRASQYLMRFSPADTAETVREADPDAQLQAIVERIPDPFAITDTALKIVTVNTAFLDLVRVASKEQAAGQGLDRFLGRPGLDRNILADTLRAHGSVRNFATVLRNQYDEQEDVEVSAVATPDGALTSYGFTIRPVGRRSEKTPNAPDLHRSVEKLTELVGRVTLKDLVRETTDLVERLCIEAALELTKNNRASAADVLGISRQSLYSKLNRFDLAKPGDDEM